MDRRGRRTRPSRRPRESSRQRARACPARSRNARGGAWRACGSAQGAHRALRGGLGARRRAQRLREARLVIDQRLPGGFARGVRSRGVDEVLCEQRGDVGGARILDERESLDAAGRLQPGPQLAERGGGIRIEKAGKRRSRRPRAGCRPDRFVDALLDPLQNSSIGASCKNAPALNDLWILVACARAAAAARRLDQAIVQAAAVRFVTDGREFDAVACIILAGMPEIVLDSVSKHYGAVRAVDGVSLRAAEGKFLVLLGPSGCGKSTVLRLIAGLEDVTPQARSSSPGATSRASTRTSAACRWCSSPTRCSRTCRSPRTSCSASRCAARRRPSATERLARVAELVGLTEQLERKPSQLSGGQRQRVALARADRRREPDLPDGRAALQPRRAAAPRHARRDPRAAAAPRHDGGLRHARPGRGDEHGRPRDPRCARGASSRRARPRSSTPGRRRSSPRASSARRR